MRTIQEVTLKLKSRIHHSENEKVEETAFTTTGLIAIKDNTLYLRYDEVMAEIGTVHHTVKVKTEEATVLRQGPISMRMPLALNLETEGSYKMPFGRMEMLTHAKKLDYKWDEQKQTGTIDLVYDLTIQGEHVGLCEISYHLSGGKL